MSAPETPFISDRASPVARAPGRVGMSPLAHPATPIEAHDARLFQSAGENETAPAGLPMDFGDPIRCHGLKSLIMALQALDSECEALCLAKGLERPGAILFWNARTVEVSVNLSLLDGRPYLQVEGFNE